MEVVKKRGRPKGSGDKQPRGGRKLTEEQVVEIRRLYFEDGLEYTDIALQVPGVSRQNIEQIILRKIWKSIPMTFAEWAHGVRGLFRLNLRQDELALVTDARLKPIFESGADVDAAFETLSVRTGGRSASA